MSLIVHPITKNNTLYHESVSAYPFDHRGVKWSSAESQFLRFKVLCEIAPDVFQRRLLDVGCGLGHLVDYLVSQNYSGEYKGIDWVEQMIVNARKRHPTHAFETNDISSFAPNQYDYVLASGIFAFAEWEMMQETIQALTSCAVKGVAFNCLNVRVPQCERESAIHYYDPDIVLEYCQKIVPKVTIRQDYLESDFTVYMYKI